MEKTERGIKIEGGLIKSTGDEFDPKELSEKIHKRVREKIDSGFYDSREIDKISKFKAQIPEQLETSNQHIIHTLNSNWDILRPIDLKTHRSGLTAKLAMIAKMFYQQFVHKPLKFSLTRQALFNQAVKTAVEEIYNLRVRTLFISQRITNLDERFANLEGRLRTDEQANDRMDDRVKNLETQLPESVKRLERSLRDIDKQGIFLKDRVANALDEIKSAAGGKELAEVAERESAKLDSFDYMLFENLHRGSREEIKSRFGVYMDWFKGAKNVLDVGCGRGEMLELFKENGIEAHGVDLNNETVKDCRERGFAVEEQDALSYLNSLPDSSLGGLTAVQFVEHLPVEVMADFFKLAYEKLDKGAVIAAETINAACLTTFCSAFYLDLSHYKPIHPLALQFLLERIGFEDVRVEYLNPYPEDIRLSLLPESGPNSGLDKSVIDEYNQNVMKLNNVLYSHTDYAVVAKR